MYKKLFKKILIFVVTALFIEIWVMFLKGINGISHIIPFVNTIMNRHLSAYDFFFIISVWLFFVVYRYYQINPVVELRKLRAIFSDFRTDMGIAIITVLPSHFLLFPLLYQIFQEPITDMGNSAGSIRNVIAVMLPVMWLLIIAFINKDGSANNGTYNVSMTVQRQIQKQTENMPPPPSW